MSETTLARVYCQEWTGSGLGIDIGFGGDAVTKTCLTMDMERPYTRVGGDRQHVKGSVEKLDMFCNEAFDWVYTSHLLEDFGYEKGRKVVKGLRRILQVGGVLITVVPDQQEYVRHCRKNGTQPNAAHKEASFSPEMWMDNCLHPTGAWEVLKQERVSVYSHIIVAQKRL